MMTATDLKQAEARLPRWMMGLAVLATIAVLLTGHPSFAAGFVLGAAVALVNYFWLHQAVEHLMAASTTRLPRTLIAKFLLRYPLLVAGVYLLYRTGWVSSYGFLAGLFVPVGGVLIESAIQIRDGLRNS